MSNQLIPNEDYKIEVTSENGVFTVRSLDPNSPSNNGVLGEFTLNSVPGESLFDENNLPMITTLQELLKNLSEVLIRFDSNPEYYQKGDFAQLLKTVTESLIYLYRYFPNLVRLLTAFVDLENDEELTIVKKLTVSKEIVGKIITSKEGFIKEESSDEEVLLGGGGTKTLQSIYDISAGVVKEYSDDTLDLLEQTIVVKNEVDELKSETQQIKVDTQQLKSDVQITADYIEQLADSIGLGSPKGVYDTLDDLLYDDPDNQYIYVVLDTGNWYYWGDNEWKSGGFYQAPIDEYYDQMEKIIQDIKDIQDSKVFLSASDYQILLDNDLIIPDVEYNIYEDDN